MSLREEEKTVGMRGSGSRGRRNIVAVIRLRCSSCRSGRSIGILLVKIRVGSIVKDARDGVESIWSDSRGSRGGSIAVHHGEKSGGAGGREASDERSETSSGGETGARCETGTWSEACTKGRRIKAEMVVSRIRLRLRTGEHGGGEWPSSERIDRIIIISPGIRSFSW